MNGDLDGFEAFLRSQPQIRGSTTPTYMQRARTMLRWGDKTGVDLVSCEAGDLVPLVASTPNTYSSRVLLKAVLKWWWVYVGRDDPPLGVVTIPSKPVYYCRALSEGDAHKLAQVAMGRHPQGTAVIVGLYMGLRISEIASMEWTRFTGDGWYFVFGKGLKERMVPVARHIEAHLRELPREHPRWVFPGSGQQPHVHRSTVWKWISKLATESGVGPVAPHRLRHTFAATVNDTTGDFRTTQDLMGHTDPKTTALYTRSTRKRMEDAIGGLDYLEPPTEP